MTPLIDYHAVPTFALSLQGEPDESRGVHVVVETPMGARNKFALHEQYGLIELSRTLKAGLVWPCDFGFIPGTHGGDGDPLDVCLMLDAPTFPGCLVRARLLGVIGFRKNGEENDRVLACPAEKAGAGSAWDQIRDLPDLSRRRLRELESFLHDYNAFEGHHIELTGWRDAASALATVKSAAARWQEAHRRSSE